MAPREDFVWEHDVDTSSMPDPKQQIKASVFEGKLHVHINEETFDIDLPEDAFTDDAHAKVENRKLEVRIARRDPNGPAMQEKRMFNPDRHPVELTIDMPKELATKAGKPPMPTQADKTPAQQSVSEFNEALYGEPAHAHKMPAVNMGSSIVTAMPVMVNEGGVMDTVSKGETVVRVPGSSETHHLSGIASSPGETLPADELAEKLRDTAVHDSAPPGAKVLHGQKERENEAAFDERAMAPAVGMAAGGSDGGAAGGGQGVTRVGSAAAPAGDEEHLRATGQRGEKVRSDFVTNKVGMEYEERDAADAYVGAESKVEPISTMKQAGAELCELCACAPCQCDKMKKTGGTGNDPFELTPAETKRGGRPALHSPHSEITGKNAHPAHDYRGHAKQVNEHHMGIGGKLGDYQGNVSEGVGDPSDPKYSHLPHPEPRGATHTGGAPIEFGGPGKRHVSDQAKGGPIHGGSKTTFTTMG